MAEQQQVGTAAPRRPAVAVLSAAAWMAILLGLAVQLLVLLAKAAAGGAATATQYFVDIAAGMTWSVLVCSGVALGTVVARHRSVIMGVLGLLSAPVAGRSRGAQRGMQWMLNAPSKPSALWSTRSAPPRRSSMPCRLVLGCMIYTPLDPALARAIDSLRRRVRRNHSVAEPSRRRRDGSALPMPRIAAICINELIFPMGCAIVIYWALLTARAPRAARGGWRLTHRSEQGTCQTASTEQPGDRLHHLRPQLRARGAD
jgi:hypothetical protein